MMHFYCSSRWVEPFYVTKMILLSRQSMLILRICSCHVSWFVNFLYQLVSPTTAQWRWNTMLTSPATSHHPHHLIQVHMEGSPLAWTRASPRPLLRLHHRALSDTMMMTAAIRTATYTLVMLVIEEQTTSGHPNIVQERENQVCKISVSVSVIWWMVQD